jgi:hypothetical protein
MLARASFAVQVLPEWPARFYLPLIAREAPGW